MPLGIVSNNGGSVIGQNGANVIGQNGANIVSNNGANVIGQNGANVIGQNGANVIGQNGANVIGQNGANIISNNGGSVIGQNGANIVNNNGGNVIGQNGANIVSNNGGSLGQRPLAYASLRVVDAAGKLKIGKNGQPLEGKADAWGQFLVPREEIDANCVIQVSSPLINGELKAFVSKGASSPEKELEIDMVSTLATTFILDQFIDGDQKILEKLTPEIEAEARSDVRSALESKVTNLIDTTETSQIVSLVNNIISEDVSVQDVFERIEKLLIISGITNDGDGHLALDVPLGHVGGMKATSIGLFLFMPEEHKLLLVTNDGRIKIIVKQNSWPYAENVGSAFTYHAGMDYHNGWLYLCDTINQRIVRMKSDSIEVLAGTGTKDVSPDGVNAKEASLYNPAGIAVDTNGIVYFTERRMRGGIRRINNDGKIETVAGGGTNADLNGQIPARDYQFWMAEGLTFESGGNLLVTDSNLTSGSKIISLNIDKGTITTKSDRVVYPTALAEVGGRIFTTSNGEHGHSTVLELDDNSTREISPFSSSDVEEISEWLFSPTALTGYGGHIYIQQRDNQVVAINLNSPISAKPIAGLASKTNTDTLIGAGSFSINANGDMIIAAGSKIFLQRKGKPLAHLAGNGDEGWTPSANNAQQAPIFPIRHIRWDDNETAMFVSEKLRLTSADKTFPTIQTISTDGSLKTVIGNGENANGTPGLGKAVEISLNDPKWTAKLRDGTTLLLDTGYNYILQADGSLSYSPSWPATVDVIEGIDNRNETVFAISNGDKKVVATSSDLKKVFGADFNFLDTTTAEIDAENNLYIATENQIAQIARDMSKSRILGGKGGVLFNRDSRDTSFRTIRDLEISPDGDLIILESDQIKRIPFEILREWKN